MTQMDDLSISTAQDDTSPTADTSSTGDASADTAPEPDASSGPDSSGPDSSGPDSSGPDSGSVDLAADANSSAGPTDDASNTTDPTVDATSDATSSASPSDDTTSSNGVVADASTSASPSDDANPGDDTSASTITADQPTNSANASGTSGTLTLADAPTRPYGVESWRPLVTEMAVDIPVEVLLRWIKHESGGNPCSTGKIVNGSSIENGLFQLYSPDDDHLATPAQLHGSFCSSQTCTRDLTLDEARLQVASGIAYVRLCRERARAQLSQAGVSWDEAGSDFWSLVKMQHNLPSVPKLYIPQLKPASWADFKAGVLKAAPKYGSTSIFSNAEDIGAAA